VIARVRTRCRRRHSSFTLLLCAVVVVALRRSGGFGVGRKMVDLRRRCGCTGLGTKRVGLVRVCWLGSLGRRPVVRGSSTRLFFDAPFLRAGLPYYVPCAVLSILAPFRWSGGCWSRNGVPLRLLFAESSLTFVAIAS
jgi:hypothetical protein